MGKPTSDSFFLECSDIPDRLSAIMRISSELQGFGCWLHTLRDGGAVGKRVRSTRCEDEKQATARISASMTVTTENGDLIGPDMDPISHDGNPFPAEDPSCAIDPLLISAVQ